MRKLFIIVAVSITIFGLLITASPYILRLFNLDKPVKRFIIPKIIGPSQTRLDVENFRIGLGKLELENGAVASRDRQYRMLLKQIEFDFNFLRFLKNPTRLQKAIKNVYLVEPRLILNRITDSSSVQSNTKEKLHYQNIQDVLKKIRAVRHLDRVNIKNGRVIWETADRQFIAIADNLNGWLHSSNLQNIELNMTGSLSSDSEQNFKTITTIDLKNKAFKSILQFINYELHDSPIRYLRELGDIEQGMIDGEIVLANTNFNIDSTKFFGSLSFDGLRGHIRGYRFSNITFHANIENNRLTIDKGSGNLFSDSLNFELSMANIWQPTVKFKARIEKTMFGKLLPERHLQTLDNVFGDLAVEGQYDFKKHDGLFQFASNALNHPEYGKCSQFKAQLTREADQYRFRLYNAEIGRYQFQGTGRYIPGRHRLWTRLDISGAFDRHKVFDRLSQKQQRLQLNVYVNTRNRNMTGNWQYAIAQSIEDTLLWINGKLEGNRRFVHLESQASNSPDFDIDFKISRYLNDIKIERAEINLVPIHRFISEPFLQKPFKRFATRATFKGTANQLDGNIEIFDRQNPSDIFVLRTSINRLLKDKRLIKGTIHYKNIDGNYHVNLTPSKMQGEFKVNHELQGDLKIDLLSDKPLSGTFNFDDFNIMRLFADSVLSDDFRFQGSIDGQITLSGTLNDPVLNARLSGEKFVFNDVGYYQAEASLNATRERWKLDSLAISLNNIPILKGTLEHRQYNNELDGFISGSGVNAEQLFNTFFKETPYISGQMDYRVRISGPSERPVLSGAIDLQDGVLDKIKYDKINIAFNDSLLAGIQSLDYAQHKFYLKTFEMSEMGKYHLTANGALADQSENPIDLDVHYQGDVFFLLPYLNDFFERGSCNSDIALHIAGKPDQLRIMSGRAVIERGELWMDEVAKHVDNIHGVIELEKGTNRVNFINFEGKVGETSLTINTVRDVVLANGDKLDSWYFESLDLDFGVLAMQTDAEGIQLHIPGLMHDGDTGRLHLSGKEEGEMFYFAGPLKHPVVRGAVTLYNVRLTYPFIQNESKDYSDNPAVEFLRNINWDVKTLSGEDVLYVREIPAYIGKVNTELYIDESSEGLEFSGIIEEHTFNPTGKMVSQRGRLEYLDQNFRVERFSAEFNEYSNLPIISGRAWTTIRDSVGAIPKTIYLKLYAVDEETGSEIQQGRWEDFRFKLVSADPQIGETQEQVLAYMGFSVGNIKQKATSVGGAVTERYLIRPLLRPIERTLERKLGMDMVRINSNIARNLFYSSLITQQNYNFNSGLLNPFATETPYLFLMQSSEVTLGKYITQDLFLTYTGQLVSVYDQTETELELNHSVGIEYRFFRNVLLELEYDRELIGYYRLPDQKQYFEDFKIRLRHSFTF